VPARERRIDRGRRLATRAILAIGEELREARLQACLTQEQVGAAVGVSGSEVSRIEHGQSARVPFEVLCAIAAAVGLDLSLRAYPNGDRVRDAGQLALLARFRAALAPSLAHRLEVPLPIAGDRRAWDLLIIGDGWSVPVEAEIRLRDVQALTRRLPLKIRDGGCEYVLLVVADTRTNRQVVRAFADAFAPAFPGSGKVALNALRTGSRPPAGALIFL
jgi:transcriptional regulator with XRE-family HTH domain